MNGYVRGGRAPIRTTRPRCCCEAGKQLAGFAQLRDDGTTACGCWIFAGCYTEDGNMMARRDNADPASRRLSRTGPSPGRPTGGSSTTAPPPTSTASHGIRRAS